MQHHITRRCNDAYLTAEADFKRDTRCVGAES
jgi:hypothetical protein